MSEDEKGGNQLSSEQFTKLLAAINESQNETKQLRKEIINENNKLKIEFQNELQKLKDEIKQSNIKYCKEVEIQNKTIKSLHRKCEELETRCIKFERNLRKNNLVIFGLKTSEQGNLFEYIGNQIKQLLGITLQECELNNVFPLKVEKGNPLKIEFRNLAKKELILRSAYKLKGTGVTIAQDLCFEDRENKKIIVKHYKQAKSDNLKVKIKGNTLVIGNEVWTVERLKQHSNATTHSESEESLAEERNLPITAAAGKETLTQTNAESINSEGIITQKSTANIHNGKIAASTSRSNFAAPINERVTRQKQGKK